ncbi:MAG: hypothetical protein OXG08_11645 [Gammaproteobacteria bacterium]|nr:hypothetical protein [Gammaproteobacteria bacterium]
MAKHLWHTAYLVDDRNAPPSLTRIEGAKKSASKAAVFSKSLVVDSPSQFSVTKRERVVLPTWRAAGFATAGNTEASIDHTDWGSSINKLNQSL